MGTKTQNSSKTMLRNVNIIWEIKHEDSGVEKSFDHLASPRSSHFKTLFKAPTKASIVEVIQVAQFFLRYAEEEENDLLMDPNTKGEVEGVIKSM